MPQHRFARRIAVQNDSMGLNMSADAPESANPSAGHASLLLVDGYSFLYRAYHAMPPLSTSVGVPTGAIRGFVNMLNRLLERTRPEYLALVFDAPGANFRHELYPDYKANRPPMPDDLRAQVGLLLEVLEAEGYPVIRESGVEADDVLATLALQASKDECHVLVASSDKDLTQLVRPFIRIYHPSKEIILDEPAVQEKFGVPPHRMADYLALLGDTADHIPGVPGVGAKTAQKLIEGSRSWEDLLTQIPQMSGKVGLALKQALPRLPLMHQLTTVRGDVPVRPWQQLLRGDRDVQRLSDLYHRLEFRAERAGLPELASRTNIVANAVLQRQEEPARAFFELHHADELHLDEADVVVFGVYEAGQHQEVWYFMNQPTDGASEERVGIWLGALTQMPGWSSLKDWLECESAAKAVWDCKELGHRLAAVGGRLLGVVRDVHLALFLLDVRQSLDLAVQAKQRWGLELSVPGTQKDLFAPPDLPHVALQAGVLLRIYREVEQELQEQPVLLDLLKNVDQPFNDVLLAMELHGVCVDVNLLRAQSAQLGSHIDQLRQSIHEQAGLSFNIDSPRQLADVLYDRLGLAVSKKTATGQRSTAESVLEVLAIQHPVPALCLEYRRLSKLKSTYTDKLPLLVRPDSGRIHTTYNPVGTSTGRLSSSEPNLQNIPIRSTEGRRIREAFVAPEGSMLLSADYSQIELRIMAHYSGDAALVEAFRLGRDVHRATAAEIFAVGLDEVDDAQRRAAKAINFGLIYGMSAFGLAQQLGCSRQEADAWMKRYFARYPGIEEFMERTRVQAQTQGYVETLLGRRLHIPPLAAMPAVQKAAVLRAAINAPMQGSAADIMKKAMLLVSARLRQQGDDRIHMVLQVHDELVLEVPEALCAQVAEWVSDCMCQAVSLRVPLEVSCSWGRHWGAAH